MADGPKFVFTDENPLNLARHISIPMHETEPDTFQNISEDSPLPVSNQTDTSLTGEQVVSLWHPQVYVSFNNTSALPEGLFEVTKTAGVNVDLSGFQLKVTVPAGDTYRLMTEDVVEYVNGQETRIMFTSVYESDPEVGVTAIMYAMSSDMTTGFGIGHHDGAWVFAWRFDNTTTYYPIDFTSVVNQDGSGANPQAPQICRLRMLYLGFGPLIHEVQDANYKANRLWIETYSKTFTNDLTWLQPNLSDPDLGIMLEIVNGGTSDAVFRTNSLAIGSVLGDRGENAITAGKGATTGQQSVGISPSVLGVSVPNKRRAIRLKNLSTSARSMFYGFTPAVSITSGDELAPGEAVTIALDEDIAIYVVTQSTSGGGVQCSWSQVSG